MTNNDMEIKMLVVYTPSSIGNFYYSLKYLIALVFINILEDKNLSTLR